MDLIAFKPVENAYGDCCSEITVGSGTVTVAMKKGQRFPSCLFKVFTKMLATWFLN
jgi:hypothetical protein